MLEIVIVKKVFQFLCEFFILLSLVNLISLIKLFDKSVTLLTDKLYD